MGSREEPPWVVVGEIRAGLEPAGPLRAGQAVRIATGAVVPTGAFPHAGLSRQPDQRGRAKARVRGATAPGWTDAYASSAETSARSAAGRSSAASEP